MQVLGRGGSRSEQTVGVIVFCWSTSVLLNPAVFQRGVGIVALSLLDKHWDARMFNQGRAIVFFARRVVRPGPCGIVVQAPSDVVGPVSGSGSLVTEWYCLHRQDDAGNTSCCCVVISCNVDSLVPFVVPQWLPCLALEVHVRRSVLALRPQLLLVNVY
jgi:hypothetical protein